MKKKMTLGEMSKLAGDLGISYGELEELIRKDKLEEFKKKKFHEECQRNADNVIVEKSWIGNAHGNHCKGR